VSLRRRSSNSTDFGLSQQLIKTGNRYPPLKKRRDRILLSGALPSIGFVPVWISSIYMLGVIGWIVSGLSAFAITWWAPGLIVCLYFLIARLVPSQIVELKAQLKANGPGPLKKCSQCGTIRKISYFSFENSSSDGHGSLCVACLQPETWAFTQKLKSALANEQRPTGSMTAKISHLAAIQQATEELSALPPGEGKMNKVMQRADEIMRSWGWTPNQ
jgi:hypothetical protein